MKKILVIIVLLFSDKFILTTTPAKECAKQVGVEPSQKQLENRFCWTPGSGVPMPPELETEFYQRRLEKVIECDPDNKLSKEKAERILSCIDSRMPQPPSARPALPPR